MPNFPSSCAESGNNPIGAVSRKSAPFNDAAIKQSHFEIFHEIRLENSP